MPLLGKHMFTDYRRDKTNDEFKIDFTGETFPTAEQRDKKLSFYSQKQWTCQSTLQVNLTYKEAQQSEKQTHEILKKRCLSSWEKPMLEVIHHSTDGLDALITHIRKLFQVKYFKGEQVNCEPSTSKKFNGEIVAVTRVVTSEGESSPSSDKENNKTKQKLITDMFQKIQSPEKSNTESLKPQSPPPSNSTEVFKYDIQLAKEKKIVKGVPEKVLTRIKKAPSKETVKTFIRTNALQASRGNASGKVWIVNKTLVEKYDLPSKISEELESKFMKSSTAKAINYDKYKQLNGSMEDESDFKTKNSNKSKVSKSPQKSPQKNDRVTITNGGYISDDDDIPLSSLFNVSKKKQQSLAKAKVNGSMRKSTTPKKKKQATLLELTRKKGGMKVMTSVKSSPLGGSPKTTPRKQYRQPPIVCQLMSLKKEKNFRQRIYAKCENKAAKILSHAQIAKIPESIKAPIVAKREMFDKKERWNKMTDEEKKEELARRRMALKQEMLQLYEDQHLVAQGKSTPLPVYDLLTLHSDIPNTAFGDIAMVVEFVNAYKDCISSPRDNLSLTCEQLINAITSGIHGNGLLSKIFVLIFQTLLGDDIAKEYTELDYRLNKVEVNSAICSELARICFRKYDDNEVNEDDDDDLSAIPTELDEKVYLRLLENEITELQPLDQLEILVALVNRILGTNSVDKRLNEAAVQRTKALKNYRSEKSSNKEVTDEQGEDGNADGLGAMINDLEIADVDLVTRVKNRKLISEKQKELEEIERKRKDKLQQLLLREQGIDKSRRQYLSQCRAREKLIRTKPLGVDRNHSRYWCFSDNIPGLFIEKGWSSYMDYSMRSTDSTNVEQEHSLSDKETTLPPVGQNLWFVLRSKEDLDKLIEALCQTGYRESKLRKALQNNYTNITRSIGKFEGSSLMKKDEEAEAEEPEEPKLNLRKKGYDAVDDMKNTLVKSLSEFARETSQGGLAELDSAVMEVRISTAENISDFREILEDLLQSVKKDCLTTFLHPPKEARKGILECTNRRVERWISAVENATHASRLLLLFQMLNDSVRWDMYHYQRTRKGARKNYADINQGKESDEEEEVPKEVRSARLRNKIKKEDSSSAEDEEEKAVKKVRSERLRNRNKAKVDSSSEEEDEEQITRSQRLRKRNKQKQPSSSEDDEPRRGRSTRSRGSKRQKVESDDEGGSRYGLRKRAKVEVNDSEDEEVQPRSSRRRSARRSRYESEQSEQEEEEEAEDEEEAEGSSMEEGSDDNNEEEDESDEDVPIHEDEEVDLCREVFRKMRDYKCACPFKYPVDPEEVVDYHEIVLNPISLQDIGKKIEEEEYCGNQFVDDMKLLFTNADAYNEPDNFIMRQCTKLNNIFVRLYTEKFGRSKAHMEYFSTHFQV